MAAKLVAEEGLLTGLELPLDEGDSWVIGRDPEECQLVIEDPLASRRHLIARKTPEGILVENLSSTNPTQINETPISNPYLLHHGDTIRIGGEVFRFYTDTPSPVGEEQQNNLNNENHNNPTETPEMPPSTQELKEQTTVEDNDDTIFETNQENPPQVEINFGIAETGRWLLKVVGGPNNGAEFYMQTGHTYVLGTDPHTCDIVFHDTSVSRQHARITVTDDDSLWLEDLKSRNGILINNERLNDKQILSPSVIVTVGTTSFVIYDREGEMQTIISPLLPSIVKVLQEDEASKQHAEPKTEENLAISEVKIQESTQTTPPSTPTTHHWGAIILLSILLGLFSIMSVATYSLFKVEHVVQKVQENANELISQVTAPFPEVKFSFNKANDSLLLLGHISTVADKNQLLYGIQTLNFIKSIDDSGLVIDEGVWREINSILGSNPAWQGISIHSPTAGEFILSGYLKTKKQAEQLSDYLNVNFPYLDRLKNQVVVEEDVINQANNIAQQYGLKNINIKLLNGEITLNGTAPNDKEQEIKNLAQKIKEIPGVRVVNNLIKSQSSDIGNTINISSQYEITGQSKVGNKYTVIINGRILTEGDVIDGMIIKRITPNTILLEQGDLKYRIDYNK